MNWLNTIIGLLIIFPFYSVVKTLFNKDIAFYTTLILIVTPSFWLSTVAGHPHLVGFFFFILTLFCIAKGFQQGCSHSSFYVLFAIISWTVTLTIKTDIILASLVFVGLLYWKGITTRKNLLFILVFLMASTGLYVIVGYYLLPKEVESPSFFFIKMLKRYLGIRLHATIPPLALGAGIATFLLSILLLLYYWIKDQYRFLFFLTSWFVVPTIFWLIFISNSARHNMMYVPPLIITIVYYLYYNHRKNVLPLIILLMVANYYIVPPGGHASVPSGRLLSNYVDYPKKIREHYTNIPIQLVSDKKTPVFIFVVGYNPGYLFNILLSTENYQLLSESNPIFNYSSAKVYNLKPHKKLWIIKNNQKEYMLLNVLPDDWKDYSKMINDMNILKKEIEFSHYYFHVGVAPGWINNKVAREIRSYLISNQYNLIL